MTVKDEEKMKGLLKKLTNYYNAGVECKGTKYYCLKLNSFTFYIKIVTDDKFDQAAYTVYRSIHGIIYRNWQYGTYLDSIISDICRNLWNDIDTIWMTEIGEKIFNELTDY